MHCYLSAVIHLWGDAIELARRCSYQNAHTTNSGIKGKLPMIHTTVLLRKAAGVALYKTCIETPEQILIFFYLASRYKCLQVVSLVTHDRGT